MYDLVIIGSGPAGLTAGLYAGRYRLNSVILEKMVAGGQIITSPTIDNYPGFPSGIPTQELIDRFLKQIEEVGVGIETADVQEIIQLQNGSNPLYEIKSEEKTYQAKSLIIASGAYPKKLAVPGEDKLIGRGVSYCGTCDGPLFRNKDIVLVGGGDRALEEAVYLAGYATSVTVVHRRSEFRASKILQEKAKGNPKIKFVLDSVIEEISGGNRVESVRLKNAKTNSITSVLCNGVFVFVGMLPNSANFKLFLQADESGFIITDQNLKTSREGVFACGDVRKKNLYQVVTACADGAIAADSAFKYLMNQGN